MSLKVNNIIEEYNKDIFDHLYISCGYLGQPNTYKIFQKGPTNIYFDLASLTKAIVTVPLILKESSDSSLDINEKVSTWIKGTNGMLRRTLESLSISDLLSHTSGLPAWRNFWINRIDSRGNLLSDKNNTLFLNNKLNSININRPGEFVYSDIGYIVLQKILEFRHQLSIKQIFYNFLKRSFKDLDKIQFNPVQLKKEQIASTGFCPVRDRNLVGEVNDMNCFALGGAAGHAGLFAQGHDVTNFLEQFLLSDLGQKFALDSQKLMKEKNNIGLLGWRKGDGLSSKGFTRGQSIGHLGWTGTGFWVNPEDNFFAVVLTNSTIKGRDKDKILSFRTKIFKAISDEFWQK